MIDTIFDKSPIKLDSPNPVEVNIEEITPVEVNEIDECSQVRFKKGDSLFCSSFATNTGSEKTKVKLNLGLKLNTGGVFAMNPLKSSLIPGPRSNHGGS